MRSVSSKTKTTPNLKYRTTQIWDHRTDQPPSNSIIVAATSDCPKFSPAPASVTRRTSSLTGRPQVRINRTAPVRRIFQLTKRTTTNMTCISKSPKVWTKHSTIARSTKCNRTLVGRDQASRWCPLRSSKLINGIRVVKYTIWILGANLRSWPSKSIRRGWSTMELDASSWLHRTIIIIQLIRWLPRPPTHTRRGKCTDRATLRDDSSQSTHLWAPVSWIRMVGCL